MPVFADIVIVSPAPIVVDEESVEVLTELYTRTGAVVVAELKAELEKVYVYVVLPTTTSNLRFPSAILDADTLSTVTTQLEPVFDTLSPALFAVPGEWVNPLTITYRTAASTTVIATINMVAMTGETPLSFILLANFFEFILFSPAATCREGLSLHIRIKGLRDRLHSLIISTDENRERTFLRQLRTEYAGRT